MKPRLPVTLALTAMLTLGAALGLGVLFAPGTETEATPAPAPMIATSTEQESQADTVAEAATEAEAETEPTPDPMPEADNAEPPAEPETSLAQAARRPAPDVAAPEGRRNIGWNLQAVTYWGTQQPFIDGMRTAMQWVGHLPDQWGGRDAAWLAEQGALDEGGWPLRVPEGLTHISTMIFDQMPAEMTSFAGRYRARWDGDGRVAFTMGARNVRYQGNTARFDFTPGTGPVTIELRGGSLRNLTIVHEDLIPAHEAGEVFHPDFLALIGDAAKLRFLNWMLANNSELAQWQDRPQLTDYSFEWRGVPLELMIRLANETGAEPWFTLPHLADDDFIRRFAGMVHAELDPGLRAWIEYSNEVWNFGFQQTHWAEEQARARWGREWAWMQFYGMRASQMVQIFDEVFAGAPERLVRVIATFTAAQGMEQDTLDAPLWRAEDPDNPAPYTLFDAYAVTAYFNSELHNPERRAMIETWLQDSAAAARAEAEAQGLSGAAREDFIATHRFDHAVALAGEELLDGRHSGRVEGSVAFLTDQVLPYHREVAEDRDLALVMYEGGTHVVTEPAAHGDTELVAFFEAINHSEPMAEAYRAMMAGWAALTPAPFTGYTAIGAPTIWGGWGALRHHDDDNPRWRAIMDMSER